MELQKDQNGAHVAGEWNDWERQMPGREVKDARGLEGRVIEGIGQSPLPAPGVGRGLPSQVDERWDCQMHVLPRAHSARGQRQREAGNTMAEGGTHHPRRRENRPRDCAADDSGEIGGYRGGESSAFPACGLDSRNSGASSSFPVPRHPSHPSPITPGPLWRAGYFPLRSRRGRGHATTRLSWPRKMPSDSETWRPPPYPPGR